MRERTLRFGRGTNAVYPERMLRPIDRLALEMLVGDSTILDVAREVSAALTEAGLEGGVVGGVAVFLHGYRRSTVDVDIYASDLERLAAALRERGFVWEADARQFRRGEVPVQMLGVNDRLPFRPERFGEVDGVRVVTLGDLLSMKLASGTGSVTRARDLADVVDLVRTIGLDKSYTPRIATPYRDAFKRLIDSIRDEEAGAK